MILPAVCKIAFDSTKFAWIVISPFLLLGLLLASNNMVDRTIGEPAAGTRSRSASARGPSMVRAVSRKAISSGTAGAGCCARPASRPTAAVPAGRGRVPSAPATRPSGGDRISSIERPAGGGGSASQLPSGNRLSGATRPSQQPSRPDSRPGGGLADRPGANPGQRPCKGDVGNFLCIAGGVAGGAAIASPQNPRPH